MIRGANEFEISLEAAGAENVLQLFEHSLFCISLSPFSNLRRYHPSGMSGCRRDDRHCSIYPVNWHTRNEHVSTIEQDASFHSHTFGFTVILPDSTDKLSLLIPASAITYENSTGLLRYLKYD